MVDLPDNSATQEAVMARLFAREQQRVRELYALYEAIKNLVTTLDLRTLLEHVLMNAVHAIPAASRGLIMLRDDDEGVLRAEVGWRLESAGPIALSYPVDPVVWDAVTACQGAHYIPDLHTAEGAACWREIPDQGQARSLLVTPLRVEGNLVGALLLTAFNPGAFVEPDLLLLEALAAAGAAALRNAQLHEEVQRLAMVDPLTGLYNRRGFFDLALRQYDRSVRYGHPLVAIMLDIDHFKQVNDAYGHQAGDDVLAEVGVRLRKALRVSDLVGRYGGEEFVALLEDTIPGAQIAADRLLRVIGTEPIATGAGHLAVTTSIGIAAFSADCTSLDTLLQQADKALYVAKREGRNRIAIYDDLVIR
jgi:diguanylate cyclase (GGDEF)-like protein